ncbi:chaplin [Streptomyces sp. HC44]|uniref:Chaplin n=1 Tax=Streptomyces scabichelini TaxID=2711217 RepID=A0A6G4V019_9ACTN|nr:chaplin [Streptomyces scabichelini]
MFAAAAATGILSLYGSPALADTDATAVAEDSPGLVSGNTLQVPIEVPVNLCGNTVTLIAAIDHAIGNSCANISHGDDGHGHGGEKDTHSSPSTRNVPPAPASGPLAPLTRVSETHRPASPRTRTDDKPPTRSDAKPPTTSHEQPVEQPDEPPQLAETGSETSSEALATAAAASVALIAGGVAMYRRGRADSHR